MQRIGKRIVDLARNWLRHDDQKPAYDRKSTSSTTSKRRPRVAIVGAGFAGLNAAKVLASAPVEVVLVDRDNYHNFQPLLYQVATSGLDPDEVVHPIRDIFHRRKNVRFLKGIVESIDREKEHLLIEDGPSVSYDYLILATGAVPSYFGIEGAEEHALPMKSVPDAIRLRNHILNQFERCERDGLEATGEGALTFAIVGGGPTGVELAGQLSELFQRVLREDFRSIDPGKAQIVLLEMLPDLLPAYGEPLQHYTRSALEQRSVEVRTETAVAKVESDPPGPKRIHLDSGEVLPAQTLIWTAGVRAHPLADTLGAKQQKGGRLVTEADLSLAGTPNIFVAGDMCGAESGEGEMYAQLATVAIQQGRHAARQVLRRSRGEPTEPFAFTDPGTMATIGRSDAVAQLTENLHVRGFTAWLLWAFVHIYQLVGFQNRLSVFASWIYNYLTYDFNARIIMDAAPAAGVAPAGREAPGEQQERAEEVTTASKKV